MFRKGLLVVVCRPSGVGKGTLLKELREGSDKVRFSVSATTREPRFGEIEGRSYFFKTRDEFLNMVKSGELVEWVEYCDNYYGTPVKYVQDSIQDGYDIILEIEVEGALNIKKKFPESVLIFILPPSFDELEKRITERGTEEREVICKRLNKAKNELMLVDRFDYAVINDDINDAAAEVSCILTAEKLKLERNKAILKDMDFNIHEEV